MLIKYQVYIRKNLQVLCITIARIHLLCTFSLFQSLLNFYSKALTLFQIQTQKVFSFFECIVKYKNLLVWVYLKSLFDRFSRNECHVTVLGIATFDFIFICY